MSVFLIGPMGAGKTAVGKALARILNFSFLDSDAEIERRLGVDIAYLFEREGEPRFRLRESEVIADLTAQPGIVLATGGGAVLAEQNRAHLKARGFVVYLEASVDKQLERTRFSRHRPLLATGDKRGRLTELMAIREPLYRATARLIVPTDGKRVAAVAESIAAAVRAQEPAAARPPGEP